MLLRTEQEFGKPAENSISAHQARKLLVEISFFAWEMLVTPFSNSDPPVLLSKVVSNPDVVTCIQS
jgi:hypothetical protein